MRELCTIDIKRVPTSRGAPRDLRAMKRVGPIPGGESTARPTPERELWVAVLEQTVNDYLTPRPTDEQLAELEKIPTQTARRKRVEVRRQQLDWDCAEMLLFSDNPTWVEQREFILAAVGLSLDTDFSILKQDPVEMKKRIGRRLRRKRISAGRKAA